MADVVPTTLVAFGDADADDTVGPLRVRTLGRPWYVRGQRSNPVSRRLLGALAGADVVHCHQQHVLATHAGGGCGAARSAAACSSATWAAAAGTCRPTCPPTRSFTATCT